jgi:hypothetical protein
MSRPGATTQGNRAMSSSGLRLDRRRAPIKIVKPDILSLVIIAHPDLSDDEGESSSGFLRLRERHESVEAFRDRKGSGSTAGEKINIFHEVDCQARQTDPTSLLVDI